MDAYASSDQIMLIQQRLIALGWLSSDATGSLDYDTVQAVYRFQNRVNEVNDEGIYLTPISTDGDSASAVIDTDTLAALFSDSATSLYANQESSDSGDDYDDGDYDDYSDDYSDDYADEYAEG